MKKIKFLIVAAAFLLAALLPAKAQVFGGSTTITGETNSSAIQTNTFYITVPGKSISLSGISDTNETFVGSYVGIVVGTTNQFQLWAVTNSFASSTNSGTWTTNVPSVTVAIPITVQMKADIGAYTNEIYVP